MTITDEQREREQKFVKDFILLLNRHNIPVERMSAAIVAVMHGEKVPEQEEIKKAQAEESARMEKKVRQYEEEKNEAYLKNVASNPHTSAINRWIARHGYNLAQHAKNGKISNWQKIRFGLMVCVALVVLTVKMLVSSILLPIKKKRVPDNSKNGDNDLKH